MVTSDGAASAERRVYGAGGLTMPAGFACPVTTSVLRSVVSAVANEADADVTVNPGRPGLRAPDAVTAPPAVPPAAAGLSPTCLTFPARGATGRVVPVGVLPGGELQLPDYLGTVG
jgi:hypothetical protein